jgi:hypothetical protein
MPYDPRSSRPTPKVAPDEESAPIDVLLGPTPEPAGQNGASGRSADERQAPPESLPVPVRKAERAPSPVLQLAPLLLAAAIVVLLLVIRRSRR